MVNVHHFTPKQHKMRWAALAGCTLMRDPLQGPMGIWTPPPCSLEEMT